MMRIWGRIPDGQGSYLYVPNTQTFLWVEVVTDPVTGTNDLVYLTDLIQVLLLNRNESPFYANYGIPAQASVVSQIQPDIYVAETQAQFAPFFAALIISKIASFPPTYRVNVTTNLGVNLAAEVKVPV